jgi:hypothetical protein
VSGCGCDTPDCTCDDGIGYVEWPGLGFIGIDARAQGAINSSAQAGRIVDNGGAPIYIPGTSQCSASGVNANAKLAQTAGGLAVMGTQTGLLIAGGTALAAAAAPFTMGASLIIGLFPLLFQHHAQAVRKEQNVLCTAVPAANNTLDIIDQAVSGGYADAHAALQALDRLSSDFNSATSPIYKSCNAACVMRMCMDAAIATEKAKYTAMAAQQAAAPPPAPAPPPVTAPPAPASPAVVPARPNVVAAPGAPTTSSYASFYSNAPAAQKSSTPEWLPIAAVLAAGFFLVRGI